MKPLGLGRMALVRLRQRWSLALAQGLGLIAAVALTTVFPMVQSLADDVGMRSFLQQLGFKRFVTIEQPGAGDAGAYADFQALAARQVAGEVGGALLPGARYAATTTAVARSLNGVPLQADPYIPNPSLATYEGLADQVELLAGSWQPVPAPLADGPPAATISEQGASAIGLKPGDRYCVAGSASGPVTLCVSISGIWRARPSSDGYWGVSVPAYSLMLERASFFLAARALARGARSGAVFRPNVDVIRAAGAADLVARLGRLRTFFGLRRDGTVSTGLDVAIDSHIHRTQLGAFVTRIVATQLLLVALFFLYFASGHLLAQQRQQFAIWRGRGWTRSRLWTLIMVEYGFIALVGVPMGVLAAWAAARVLSATSLGANGAAPAALDLTTLFPALPATLGVALVILGTQAWMASRGGLLEARRDLSRPSAQPWWRRRNLDLVAALAGVPILAEARLRSGGQVRSLVDADSNDPLSLLLPALGLALLAIVSLRLLPLLAAALRSLDRGLAAALASSRMERQAVAHAQLALMICLAVAIGLFAGAYSTTERRNTADRVAYAAGSDLRVQFAGNYAAPQLDPVVETVRGSGVGTEVFRDTGQLGDRSLQAAVLAVDPVEFGQIAWSRPDLGSGGVPQMMRRLTQADPDGIVLAGHPERVQVWAGGSGVSANLWAEIADASGRTCSCSMGSLAGSGWRSLEGAITMPGGSPRYPLRLKGLKVTYSGGEPADGTLSLSSLAVGAGTATAPEVVEAFTASSGWWSASPSAGIGLPSLSPDQTNLRQGRPTLTLAVHPRRGKLLIRPASGAGPVPAVVSNATLSRLGLQLNQPFTLRLESQNLSLVALAGADYFPSLYPQEGDFLITARDPLLARLEHGGAGQSWPNEAWLKLPERDVGPALAALSATDATAIQDRRAMAFAAGRDPLILSLEASLRLGFGAALLLAVISFVLHFFVAARTRRAEYAILQANGLPPGTVQRSLHLEQAVLLTHSVLVGGGLGLMLAWALLPALEIGAGLSETVPPLVFTVDPLFSVGAALAVVAGAGLGGRLATRLGARDRLMDRLRQLA